MARFNTTVAGRQLRSLRALAVILGSSLVFWLTSACQTSCGKSDQQPVLYVDGKTHIDGSDRIYETTPRESEWLHFPSSRRFLLQHNLGTTDYAPLIFIAFDSHPVTSISDASDDVAIASGDVAIIEKMGCNQMLIRNDTCSEQYLYVRLKTSVVPNDAGHDVDGGLGECP